MSGKAFAHSCRLRFQKATLVASVGRAVTFQDHQSHQVFNHKIMCNVGCNASSRVQC